jgi:RNA polymerase sigma-70 factor (ECF subfamily)
MAEEVAHEVFIAAARRIRRFDPQLGTFRGWLLGIARKRYMTRSTRERRRKRHEEATGRRNGEATTETGPDRRGDEALARLPAHYRSVLEAKYLRGQSMKEIAAAAGGASVEAVESLLRRARAGFARVYEQIRTPG